MHYLCRTLSTFLFFDAILFSLSPPCPTAGICFVVSREKKITKNMKKICFSRETLLFLPPTTAKGEPLQIKCLTNTR